MLPIKRASGFGGDLIGHNPGLFSTISHSGSRNSRLFSLVPWVLLLLVSFLFLATRQPAVNVAPHIAPNVQMGKPTQGNIFVSYSYFEKDGIQVRLCCFVPYMAAYSALSHAMSETHSTAMRCVVHVNAVDAPNYMQQYCTCGCSNSACCSVSRRLSAGPDAVQFQWIQLLAKH